MPSSSKIRATLCLFGGLIRLLISALTASLYRRIDHVLKPPGVLTRGGDNFPETGEVESNRFGYSTELEATALRTTEIKAGENKEIEMSSNNLSRSEYKRAITIRFLSEKSRIAYREEKWRRRRRDFKLVKRVARG